MWLFLKNLAFTLIMPGSIGVWIPLWIASARGRAPADAHPFPWTLGWIPVAIGACIYFWCLWDFASFGRATPAPIDPPRHLVVRGLYRYARNPMYVGVLSVILGWCLLFDIGDLWIYFFLVALGFNTFVMLYEEPALKRLFGEEYAEYRRHVRRWIPGRPHSLDRR